MDLSNTPFDFLKTVSPEILAILLASLIGLFSWLTKGLLETPLVQARETFTRYVEKRIEILSEVKVALLFIAYFPREAESKEFKEHLQKILLRDGKIGYLDKKMLAAIIRISIDKTDENLIKSTLLEIDLDLSRQINKIQEENKFYTKFSSPDPMKKILGHILLAVKNIAVLTLAVTTIMTLIYLFWIFPGILKLSLAIFLMTVVFLINDEIKSI